MATTPVDEGTTDTGTVSTGERPEGQTAQTAAATQDTAVEAKAEPAGTGTAADLEKATADDTDKAVDENDAQDAEEDADQDDVTDDTDDDLADDLLGDEEPPAAEKPTAVGQGAAAVVSAVLGLVSLTGGWIGTVAAARETLIGQLHTSSSASVSKQIKEIYGDAWQTTAMWAGIFALTALVTGVVVLARPAFGTPRRVQAPWIKSVAWAGVVLGVVGLLLAVLKYTDALLALPSASS
ncbi:hypothetical protein [Streptomyces sp. YIM S03343]